MVAERAYPAAPPVAPFALGVGVERHFVLRCPHGVGSARGHPTGSGSTVEITEIIVDAVVESAVACVIEHDVHDHADATFVGLGHKVLHVGYGAHIAIHIGPVESIVAVESVVGECITLAACPSMHLLVGSSNPDGVDAEFVEVVEFLRETLDVAAVESGHISGA